MEKTIAELKGRGVEFADGIDVRGYGRVARIQMPGDFEVELFQPLYGK